LSVVGPEDVPPVGVPPGHSGVDVACGGRPARVPAVAALPKVVAVLAAVAVLEVVVAVEPLLVLGGQVPLLVDVRSVLDRGLVVAHGHVAVAADLGPGERHEVLAGAQETGVDGDPLGLVGVVVVVDVADLADLVAVAVVGGGADDVAQLVLSDHQCAPLCGDGS
jgi:hypothetical protein